MRTKLALLAAIALGACVLGVEVAHQLDDIATAQVGHDFDNYYYPAKVVRLDGGGMYDRERTAQLAIAELGSYEMPTHTYPPLLTVALVPLTVLDYGSARIAWLFFNYACLALAVLGLRRCCVVATGRAPGWAASLAFALWSAAAFAPVLDHQFQGQSNLPLLALAAWAVWLGARGAATAPWTGLCLALGAAIKLFPALLWPFFLRTGDRRTPTWTLAWCVIATALTLLVVPWSDYVAFPEVLRSSAYVQHGAPHIFDTSAGAAVTRLFGHGTSAWADGLTWALRTVPYALCVLLWFAEGGHRRALDMRGLLRIGQAFVLMGFVMRPWWLHHLVFLLFPLFVALHDVTRRQRVRSPAVVLLAFGAVWIALAIHPLATARRSLGPRWLDPALEAEFVAIVAVLVALELLIREHRLPRR